ncbi:MAG TPA: glycosyltransferase family 39 protein [Anaerolineae bacterium]|nr:glycosyltransferase family 39 protein [Anaerolineae bacterium]
MIPFIRRHSIFFSALIIFVLAFITRAGALKQYVTPDEPIWVLRSLNFATALSRGDWAGTAQIGHPGVTTMWLGSIGIVLKRLADPIASVQAIDWLRQVPALAPDNAEAFKRLGVFLTFARLPVILINTLGIVGIFLLAQKLFGQSMALLAALLMALDPFMAGLSGLLHVDGLLTTFSTLSVLSLLIAISGQRSAISRESSVAVRPRSAVRWFALSGFFAALAFLSKSPALFLTPFTFLVVSIAILFKMIPLRSALIGLSTFVICHFAFVILLYPAMWLNPIGTLQGILGLASFYSGNAVRPTFFDGQYVLNHGLTFYPTALLYRLSLIELLGLIIAIVFIVREIRRRRSNFQLPASNLYSIVIFLVYAILFIVFITPVAKKYDRYMLPVFPMLIFVAAWGIGQLSQITLKTFRFGSVFKYLLPMAVAAQVIMVAINWPYLLMHYDPLLGGSVEAQKHFAVGWGEGLGAAANWINSQPDGLQSTVATAAIPSFAPIFSGRSTGINDRGLELADYSVLTLSERQLNPNAFAQLQARATIVQTLHLGRIEGAWIFANNFAQQQAEVLNQADAQQDAIITSIDLPVSRAYHGAAKMVVLRADVTPKQIELILNDLSTHYRRLWFTWSTASMPVVQNQIQHWLSQTADLASQQSVGAVQLAAYDLRPGKIGQIDPFITQFNGNFLLLGITPSPARVQAGQSSDVVMRWQATASVNSVYTATLELVDGQGEVWSAGGDPITDQDQLLTPAWPIGHIAEQFFDLSLPREIPPGQYAVRVSIEQSNHSVGLFSPSGTFSGTAPMLATLQVDRNDQPLTSIGRTIEYPFSHTWQNAITLVGFDNGPGVVINGDPWTVNVVWQAVMANLPKLKVLWQVRGPDNALVYETRLPLSPYSTTNWRAGEIIGAHYTLRFPAELPNADYHVSLGVIDPAGQLSAGGMFTPFDVRLLHRDRSFDLPPPQYPISITFSDPAITLIGADYSATTLHAGDQLPLTLYWQAAATTDTRYNVFVHFETLDGRVITQIDSQPQGSGMPTTSWAPGQSILDVYPFTLPADTPPGAYQIVVGMYNPLDGEHLINQATGLDHVVLSPPIIIR